MSHFVGVHAIDSKLCRVVMLFDRFSDSTVLHKTSCRKIVIRPRARNPAKGTPKSEGCVVSSQADVFAGAMQKTVANAVRNVSQN